MCVITVPPFPVTNCAVPENVHTPPQKGLEFLGGWGFCKAKIFKEIYEEKISSMGRYGNFLELQIIAGGISFRTHIKKMIF